MIEIKAKGIYTIIVYSSHLNFNNNMTIILKYSKLKPKKLISKLIKNVIS